MDETLVMTNISKNAYIWASSKISNKIIDELGALRIALSLLDHEDIFVMEEPYIEEPNFYFFLNGEDNEDLYIVLFLKKDRELEEIEVHVDGTTYLLSKDEFSSGMAQLRSRL